MRVAWLIVADPPPGVGAAGVGLAIAAARAASASSGEEGAEVLLAWAAAAALAAAAAIPAATPLDDPPWLLSPMSPVTEPLFGSVWPAERPAARLASPASWRGMMDVGLKMRGEEVMRGARREGRRRRDRKLMYIFYLGGM